jgi:hypothetical protein
MVEKFFTPKEVNQILPNVKKIVEEILSRAQEARSLMTTPDPLNERQNQLIDLDRRIKALMTQLEDMGCHYKDWNFEIGLVDFPAIIHGQQVLLCWRSDEPEVAWFHGYEDGYAGRRRVTRELIFS